MCLLLFICENFAGWQKSDDNSSSKENIVWHGKVYIKSNQKALSSMTL